MPSMQLGVNDDERHPIMSVLVLLHFHSGRTIPAGLGYLAPEQSVYRAGLSNPSAAYKQECQIPFLLREFAERILELLSQLSELMRLHGQPYDDA